LGNLACTTHGATMVIPAEAYEPQSVMETVQKEKCTSLYGVPTMFIGELEHPRFGEFDFSSLRTGIMAGSPCPVEVMKKVQTVMHIPEMTIAYGMTETSPVSTQCATDDPVEKRVSTVGRIKDMIIRGGGNIYAREVEELLYGHPAIADVQVIGVPSEKYGEEVMAWVKLREGAQAGGDELATWCKGKIATYKIPRHWK